MQTEAQINERLQHLKRQMTDLRLDKQDYNRLSLVIRLTAENYEEIDPYILGIEQDRVAQLANLFPAAVTDMIHLSHLDMLDIEKICICAERFYDDLGGKNVLGIAEDDMPAFSKKISAFVKIAFPEDRPLG